MILPQVRIRQCGGSVVSRLAVLTLAYCVHNMQSTQLIIGAHTLESPTEEYQLTISTPQLTIIVHPGYIANQQTNDIALVKWPTPIGFFNHAVNLIFLPTNPSELFEKIPAIIMGYGQDGLFTEITNRLLMGTTDTIPNAECNPSYTTVQDTQICSNNPDSGVCVGDEGGPLVTIINGRYIQIGIIQVMSENVLTSCRTGIKVYTRITSFLNWIEANM